MSIGALSAIFGGSFLVSLTGTLSPGPLSTMTIRESVRWGFWAGPLLAAGHGFIELALVIGLALGLNRFFEREAVAAAIGIIGGLFLLWMGQRILRTLPQQELVIEKGQAANRPTTSGGRPGRGLLVESRADGLPAMVLFLMAAGVAVSVTNPFWLAWWASVGTKFIVESLEQGAAGVATFYTAHVLTDLGWLSLIAFVLATGRRLMSRWTYRGVLLVCGVFLVGLGAWFLVSGVSFIT